MTARIAVTGVGVVSPLAIGEAAFLDALAAGHCAIAVEDSNAELKRCARVGEFGARQVIAAGALRRMPRLTQMTVVAAKQALAEAGPACDSARLGVVAGTGLGTIDETLSFTRSFVVGGPEGASPMLFPVSVMNAVAGQLALECGLRGVNTTVNHRDQSALGALVLACDMLELGRADALLCAAFDELSPPVEHGYRKLGGLSSTVMRPYDLARDGLVPGEGAVVLVLEREQDARRRGARVRAIVGGRGETSEHRPRVGWGHAPEWPEAARAVAAAANGRPVSYVAGGGNGSPGLDERELAAVRAGLGHLPPTASILGASGEYFTSALLRVVAAIGALERQILHGTVGLEHAAPEWNAQLVRSPREAQVERVLVPAFAQGGANVVVLLERG